MTISETDPNGNTYEIATATSDMSGLFHYKWTPTMEGEYFITATFAGSKSYGPSYATCAVGVDKAAAVIPPTAAPLISSPNGSTDDGAYPNNGATSIAIPIHSTKRRSTNDNLHRYRRSSHSDNRSLSSTSPTQTQINTPSLSFF